MSRKKTYLRRNGDSPYQFLMRVPLKVLPRVKGRTILISLPPSGEEAPVLVSTKIGDFVKFSLRTRDLGVAKAREAVARSELHKLFNAVGRGPTTISQRQTVGLAGIVYDCSRRPLARIREGRKSGRHGKPSIEPLVKVG